MTPERWRQVKQIFQAALDRAPSERSAFLSDACAGDDSLRKEVESLIAAHEKTGKFIDSPAYEAAAELLVNEKTELKPGQTIASYEILSFLSRGGMGEVYLAQDRKLGRKVALKFLPASFTQDADRLRRFEQEARAASALNHPNILTIHEIGDAGGRRFIATEFVDGETLRQRVRGASMKLGEALDAAAQTASALAAAHAAGIIHRDIKPENIMLRRDGIIKVLDFGLAKLTERTPPEAVDTEAPTRGLVNTETGVVMGTAVYMSPEQARGLQVDTRTDVFSLGVVLYEMVAGRLPFEGSTSSEVLGAILGEKEPMPLARYARAVPPELERIVTKALRKDREERYQTVKDLALDLKSLKQRLEFEAELQRSTSPESGGTATVQSGPPIETTGAPTASLASGTAGLTSAIRLSPTRAAIIAVAAIVIAVAAAAYFYFAQGTNQAIDSMAILPFVNVGGDPNTEYLSDGITDSLINSLSQLPNLKVKSHSSVFRYKGREVDPQVVGRELKVEAVLTGRVVPRGDGLTISLELVDVRDNNHLWGEQYNRKLSDIFAIQEEISKEVTNRLQLRLSGAEQRRLTKRYTDNAEAYQLYLKGRFYWDKRTEDGLKKSAQYFDQAIEKDPNYALAYAGLADSYNILGTFSFLQPKEAFPKAKGAAAKALDIDDLLAEPHTSLAWVYFVFEWDYAAAEREFKRAIELNPKYPTAHSWYSMYLVSTGRTAEARAEIKRAQELDPLSLIINTLVGWISVLTRDYERALEQARKTVELDPNFPRAYWVLGLAYEQKGVYGEAIAAFQKGFALSGDYEFLAWLGHAYASSGNRREAEKVIAQLNEMAQHRYVSSYDIAAIYAGLGEKERALDWLEKAYDEHPRFLVDLGVEPKLDALRSDPRFADLVRRVHLGST